MKTIPQVALFMLFPAIIGYTLVTLSGMPIWVTVILTLFVLEILFLRDRAKPKKTDNLVAFTGKRKLFNLIPTISLTGTLLLLVYGILQVLDIWITLLESIGLIGGGIALVYIYLWINSIKYRK